MINKPIYFGVAIWGRDFCQAFMTYCLSSLLAAGNIPALPNISHQNKFLFCTTMEDWEWLQSHPNFKLLSRYITPELIEIDLISEEDYQKLESQVIAYKLYVVTQAHIKLISKMYEDQCIASLVFPDTIYAKNALKSVYPHILKEEVKAVLVHFPRFATPQLLQDLEAQNYVKPSMPIEIENRDLLRCALKHRNLEVLIQKWESLCAFDFVTDVWWPLANAQSMLFHSFMWCPVFIDYSKLASHHLDCFDNNTIDGAYLYNNFTSEDFHVITDSDEFLMISYSDHTSVKYDKKLSDGRRFDDIPKIKHCRKKIKGMVTFVDPLKLELFKYPVFLHVNDLKKKDYAFEKRVRKIIEKITSEPDKYELFFEDLRNSENLLNSRIAKRLIVKRSKKLSEDELFLESLIEKYST